MLSSALSLIIAILLLADYRTPEFIPYYEYNNQIEITENDGIVTLSFNGPYELSDGLGVGTHYISLYDTPLNQLFDSTAQHVITLNPDGEKVRTIYYISNGNYPDEVIYGLNPKIMKS